LVREHDLRREQYPVLAVEFEPLILEGYGVPLQ
jgi:hypothetical protein